MGFRGWCSRSLMIWDTGDDPGVKASPCSLALLYRKENLKVGRVGEGGRSEPPGFPSTQGLLSIYSGLLLFW